MFEQFEEETIKEKNHVVQFWIEAFIHLHSHIFTLLTLPENYGDLREQTWALS